MGLTRYQDDLNNGLLEADYIVVEMANQILGEDWMPDYVAAANNGGIERGWCWSEHKLCTCVTDCLARSSRDISAWAALKTPYSDGSI
jgi:hypothetical protein